MEFSTWLATKYRFQIRDLRRIKFPRLWRKFSKANAVAIKGKYVYVRSLASQSEYTLGRYFVHEAFHIVRQRRIRWLIYLARYAFSKSFRRYEEVNAYTCTMEYRYMKKKDTRQDPAKFAVKIRDVYRVGDRQFIKAHKQLKINLDEISRGDRTRVRDLYDSYKRTCK